MIVHRKFIITIIIITLFGTNSLFAQLNKNVPKIGNWTMLFGQIRFNEKFGIHVEGQFRDYKILNQPEQILLRTGIVYHMNPAANLTLGYASVTNFLYNNEAFENPSVNESRLWQQFFLKNNLGRVYFEHRYRLEQRWLTSQNKTIYRDRVRYLLRLNIPLNKKNMEANTIYLSFYDELFMNITSNPFDRNRLFGAVGFQFKNGFHCQLGYMAQTVNLITKSYFQTALNYTIDLRKKN